MCTEASERSAGTSGERLPPHAVDKTSAALSVDPESNERKTRAKEDDEKRLKEKEQQLRDLQVIFLF